IRKILASFVGFTLLLVASTAFAQSTLKVGRANLPKALGDPYRAVGPNQVGTTFSVFDPVVFIDETGAIRPALATSWEPIDETTWHVKLRPGVTFHNGEPLTANTIEAVFTYLTSDEGKTTRVVREIRGITSARAIDELMVEIKTAKPNPVLDRQLSWLAIPEPKAYADLGPAFGRHPVGSGPFMVQDWKADRVLGTINNRSWRRPAVERIEFILLPEMVSRLQALLSDQVHVADSLAVDDKDVVEQAGGRLLSTLEGSVFALRFNTSLDTPLRDIRVRQALNYGVDKGAYIDALLHGLSVPASQPSGRQVFGHDSSVSAYPYDPDKARVLLAEAGYGAGLKLVAEVVDTLNEARDVYAQTAADLAKIGVELELQSISLPDLISKALGKTEWKGAISTISYIGGMQRDAMRPINSFGNSCGGLKYYCDEEIQPVIAAANIEFDSSKREKLVQQTMRRYHDQAAALFLHEQVTVWGVSKSVADFALTGTSFARWDQVRIQR
ncbi:MAG: ABC transporter substrate-binding protein, partial [Proteobacteria bacterium]|nr:ABC transporter substrate-binding protein [Pseudomonadota bacterium]